MIFFYQYSYNFSALSYQLKAELGANGIVLVVKCKVTTAILRYHLLTNQGNSETVDYISIPT